MTLAWLGAMTLTGPWEPAVRLAASEFRRRQLRCRIEGELSFRTRNHDYRCVGGILVSDGHGRGGAELAGWLHRGRQGYRVEPWWTPGAQAVLIRRGGRDRITVTSPTSDLTIRGRAVAESATTHIGPAGAPPAPRHTVPRIAPPLSAPQELPLPEHTPCGPPPTCSRR